MKKSILIALVCMLVSAGASAQSGFPGSTPSFVPTNYSETLKGRLAAKLESDTAYRKSYFSLVRTLLRSERAIAIALEELDGKIRIADVALATAPPASDVSAVRQQKAEYEKEKREIFKYRDEKITPARAKAPDPDLLILSDGLRKEWLAYKNESNADAAPTP